MSATEQEGRSLAWGTSQKMVKGTMPRWEYRVVTFEDVGYSMAHFRLDGASQPHAGMGEEVRMDEAAWECIDQLGREGWELVSVTGISPWRLWFKRPL